MGRYSEFEWNKGISIITKKKRKKESSFVQANCWSDLYIHWTPCPRTIAHPSAAWAVGMAATSFSLQRGDWHTLCQSVSQLTRQEIRYPASVPGSARRMWPRAHSARKALQWNSEDIGLRCWGPAFWPRWPLVTSVLALLWNIAAAWTQLSSIIGIYGLGQ